jgi:hypothetical protein
MSQHSVTTRCFALLAMHHDGALCSGTAVLVSLQFCQQCFIWKKVALHIMWCATRDPLYRLVKSVHA